MSSETTTVESMRERFERVAADLLDNDPRLALVLAEIGGARLHRATRRNPGRAVNVGIREQLLIGVAAGMALAGYRPIVHTYAPFLVERPFEQVKLDLGHNDLGAILVSVGASFDGSASGRTHQAPEDVALLSALPGWRIDVPGHPDEAEALLRDAADERDGNRRTYIRLSQLANGAAVDAALDGASRGRLAVVREARRSGTVLVAVGPTLDPVLEAVDGLDATVLYALTVRPFDGATLRTVVGDPDRPPNVILVEPYLAGTSAAQISDSLRAVPHRLLAIGTPLAESRRYGTPQEHLSANELDAPGLQRQIHGFLSSQQPPRVA